MQHPLRPTDSDVLPGDFTISAPPRRALRAFRRGVAGLALVVMFTSVAGTTAARATWLPAGNPVCMAGGFQGQLVAIPVPGGDVLSFQNMFTLWADARDSIPAVTDLYAAGVDPIGGVYPPNGEPLVVLPGFQGYASAATTGLRLGVGTGDVVVAWNDDRNGPLDVWATRVGGQWPAAGVPVCLAPGIQHDVQIVGDPTLGAIVAWLDQRDGSNAVYAQRLDAGGVPQWTVDGIPVCTVPSSRSTLRMVPDGAGGAYLGWSDARSGYPRAYVLRLDASGTVASGWPAQGLEVTTQTGSTFDRLVADGAGGVFVTMWGWAGFPVAERLDDDGSVHAGWPAAGAPLRADPVGGFLQDAVAHDGGLVAIWAEDVEPTKIIHYDLHAQRLLADGTRASGWAPDGQVVCDADGDQIGARLADGPNIVAVWEDGRSFTDGPDLYAMRLGEDGSPDPDWTPNGVLVAGGNGRQFSPCPVWDGLGGVMIAYVDDHDFNSVETDVYAQIVNGLGQVDVPRPVAGPPALAAPAPNPATTELRLGLGGWPGAPVLAEVVDVLGRHVRSLEPEAGALRWDLRDDAGRRVAPGVYALRVRGGGVEAARKVVVRR